MRTPLTHPPTHHHHHHPEAFFCRGVRYRVTASPDWTAARVKASLWAGGLGRGVSSGGGAAAAGASCRPAAGTSSARPPPAGPADYSLVYAGRVIPDGSRLGECGVPPVRRRRGEGALFLFTLPRHAHLTPPLPDLPFHFFLTLPAVPHMLGLPSADRHRDLPPGGPALADIAILELKG